MRTGYAIRDNHQRGWLQARVSAQDGACPVTVWAQDEENALEFHRLKDAKAMLRAIRRDHRRPDRVNIIDRRWRVIV